MSKAADIVNRWKQKDGIRPQEDLNDIKKVLDEYGFRYSWKSGSHIVISHPQITGLDYHSTGLDDEWGLPTLGGKKVKNFYVKILLKYISILEVINEEGQN